MCLWNIKLAHVVGMCNRRQRRASGRVILTVIPPKRPSNCKERGVMAKRRSTLQGSWCLICAVAEGERGPDDEL